MKKNIVRQTTTDKKEYKLVTREEFYSPYWDEGIYFYYKIHRHFRKHFRFINHDMLRSYRSWKHNRKTQWKE